MGSHVTFCGGRSTTGNKCFRITCNLVRLFTKDLTQTVDPLLNFNGSVRSTFQSHRPLVAFVEFWRNELRWRVFKVEINSIFYQVNNVVHIVITNFLPTLCKPRFLFLLVTFCTLIAQQDSNSWLTIITIRFGKKHNKNSLFVTGLFDIQITEDNFSMKQMINELLRPFLTLSWVKKCPPKSNVP